MDVIGPALQLSVPTLMALQVFAKDCVVPSIFGIMRTVYWHGPVLGTERHGPSFQPRLPHDVAKVNLTSPLQLVMSSKVVQEYNSALKRLLSSMTGKLYSEPLRVRCPGSKDSGGIFTVGILRIPDL